MLSYAGLKKGHILKSQQAVKSKKQQQNDKVLQLKYQQQEIKNLINKLSIMEVVDYEYTYSADEGISFVLLFAFWLPVDSFAFKLCFFTSEIRKSMSFISYCFMFLYACNQKYTMHTKKIKNLLTIL